MHDHNHKRQRSQSILIQPESNLNKIQIIFESSCVCEIINKNFNKVPNTSQFK